uniref:Uncharacterized protein n=1 Tax=Nelumbo nucifera TaxID=4432 RepID=A0A822YGU9_NELNU|nr:TPA_asm: hypothetical protein HUJ06_010651 [Nelumbo nucifera]
MTAENMIATSGGTDGGREDFSPDIKK